MQEFPAWVTSFAGAATDGAMPYTVDFSQLLDIKIAHVAWNLVLAQQESAHPDETACSSPKPQFQVNCGKKQGKRIGMAGPVILIRLIAAMVVTCSTGNHLVLCRGFELRVCKAARAPLLVAAKFPSQEKR
ncbi:hypothetical protein X474_22210 [Dethiosulfatarculus sandiegensis]|uniref:Uncharacterized protein n=1 Tax=Dethiosulfatarculus sandiegensis TaxID=1429043 RepID=A0A0D2GA82_9BACT|nr:hypothetical protein X474_22210 [Dethiosulfatarculus sandiegensis]